MDKIDISGVDTPKFTEEEMNAINADLEAKERKLVFSAIELTNINSEMAYLPAFLDMGSIAEDQSYIYRNSTNIHDFVIKTFPDLIAEQRIKVMVSISLFSKAALVI